MTKLDDTARLGERQEPLSRPGFSQDLAPNAGPEGADSDRSAGPEGAELEGVGHERSAGPEDSAGYERSAGPEGSVGHESSIGSVSAAEAAVEGTGLGSTAKSLLSEVLLVPILLLSGVVQTMNLAGSPLRSEGEGTVVAQAWSLLSLGSLTPYGYSSDHPPLGPLQIAGWIGLTGGFSRHEGAIAAGREPMVAATVVSVLLLWLLVRKLGFGRVAASFAALIFALSPLAVSLHRVVSLDNVATPWVLLALVLALTGRRQLMAFAAAAIALGIAVLTSEHAVLFVFLVGWLMVRRSHPETRRYSLAVASSIFALMIGGYMLVAAVVAPGGAVGLLSGIGQQLTFYSSFGSVLAGESDSRSLVSGLVSHDPILTSVALIGIVTGVTDRRLRPLALTAAALVLVWLLPGGALAAAPGLLLFLVIALIAGMAERSALAVRGRASEIRSGSSRRRRGLGVLGGVVLLAAAIGAIPLWGAQLNDLVSTDRDRPVRSALNWITENLPRNSRLLVDNSVWVDLVNAGFARENVVWSQKLDTDAGVKAQSPRGWRDSDFVVSTAAVPGVSHRRASAIAAQANSTVVASFGETLNSVRISRINADGSAAAAQSQRIATAARIRAGEQLFANPGLRASAGDRALLLSGTVDERVVITLGQLLAAGPVSVGGFPERDGETGLTRRQVLVSAVNGVAIVRNGKPTAEGKNLLDSLTGNFAAQSTRETSAGLLIAFSLLTPSGLVQ